MKIPKRIKFLTWLRHIANVPFAEKSPKWIMFIAAFLFPIKTFCAHYNGLRIEYDPPRLIISGFEFPFEILQYLGEYAKEGELFEFVSREKNLSGNNVIYVNPVYMSKNDLELTKKRIRELEFMVENGLGWKDMENDISPMHEI